MAHGTALSAVKSLLVERLDARPGLADCNVRYQQPVNPLDVNSVGSREAMWFGVFANIGSNVAAEGTWDNVVFCDGGLRFDEAIVVHLIVQVLGKTDIDTQEVQDQRAEELVLEVLDELADPAFHAAVRDDTILSAFDHVIVVPARQRWAEGRLSQPGGAHAAACELGIEVRSRFS